MLKQYRFITDADPETYIATITVNEDYIIE